MKKILLLALLLRLVLINQSFWLDESTSAIVVRDFSVDRYLADFAPGDFHPPFYYLSLKAWSTVFGVGEIALRFFSLVSALLTIYMVYQIARLIPRAKDSATLGALFLAVNPLHIYYSQEVRMYSLSTFLASLIVFLYLKYISMPSIRGLMFLVLSFVIALYTFYPLIFLLLSLLLYSALTKNRAKQIFLALGLACVAFLPWFPTLGSQLQTAQNARFTLPLWWQTLGKTSFKSISLVWIKFIIGRISFYTKKGYLIFTMVSSIIPLFTLFISWIHKKDILLIWFWLLFPLLSLLLGGIFASGFAYFRLLFILPAFCLLVGYGVYRLSNAWRKFALTSYIAISLASLIIFWLSPRHQRENWRDAVKFVETHSQTSSISVFVNAAQADPYRYYAKKIPFFDQYNWDNLKAHQLWLFRYTQPIFDPKDQLKTEIESRGYKKIQEKDFQGVVIWEYQKI